MTEEPTVRICYALEDGSATTEDLPESEAVVRKAELGPDRMFWSARLDQLGPDLLQ